MPSPIPNANRLIDPGRLHTGHCTLHTALSCGSTQHLQTHGWARRECSDRLQGQSSQTNAPPRTAWQSTIMLTCAACARAHGFSCSTMASSGAAGLAARSGRGCPPDCHVLCSLQTGTQDTGHRQHAPQAGELIASTSNETTWRRMAPSNRLFRRRIDGDTRRGIRTYSRNYRRQAESRQEGLVWSDGFGLRLRWDAA